MVVAHFAFSTPCPPVNYKDRVATPLGKVCIHSSIFQLLMVVTEYRGAVHSRPVKEAMFSFGRLPVSNVPRQTLRRTHARGHSFVF